LSSIEHEIQKLNGEKNFLIDKWESYQGIEKVEMEKPKNRVLKTLMKH
jgi:hypothetical protein